MDEELRSYLEELRKDIKTMRGELNDAQERVLNRLTSLEQDFQNTKGFLIGDSVVAGRRWLDLEERVARLERGGKGG